MANDQKPKRSEPGTACATELALPSFEELTEGVDYTFENGLLVFTREYLLARGACCGSGCRHCPFQDQNQDKPR